MVTYAVGLDVGGTKIEGVLVNNKGTILARKRVPTPKTKSSDILEAITKLVNELQGKHTIVGVGLGLPGTLDKGKLLNAPNLKVLVGTNIQEALTKKLKTNICLENDANCFALAEAHYGAAKKHREVVGLIIGTGVGAGIIINQQVYAGVRAGAGEFGHIKFPYEDFDVESLISGPGIQRRYHQHAKKTLDVHDIFTSKESEAKEVVRETHEITGWLCALIMNSLNPSCIVLGGGVSNSLSLPIIRRAAKKYALPTHYQACNVVKNKLGDSSGVIGAASLVFSSPTTNI